MSGEDELQRDIRLSRRCTTDPGAAEELFRRYAPFVYRLAYRFLNDPSEAEDVVQEVFSEVFRSIHAYRGEAPLRYWLGRVAVRCAGRYLGRIRRYRGSIRLEMVEDQAGRAPAGPAELDNRTALRRLVRLLDRLGKKRKTAFVIHQLEGFTVSETAALLGISVTAAKKRIWHARRELYRLASKDELLGPWIQRSLG
jgi:RNA polymerase sigma-70 factor (ECF subfamily)